MKFFYKFFVIGLDFLIGTLGATVQESVTLINIIEINRFDVFELLIADMKYPLDPFECVFFSRERRCFKGEKGPEAFRLSP